MTQQQISSSLTRMSQRSGARTTVSLSKSVTQKSRFLTPGGPLHVGSYRSVRHRHRHTSASWRPRRGGPSPLVLTGCSRCDTEHPVVKTLSVDKKHFLVCTTQCKGHIIFIWVLLLLFLFLLFVVFLFGKAFHFSVTCFLEEIISHSLNVSKCLLYFYYRGGVVIPLSHKINNLNLEQFHLRCIQLMPFLFSTTANVNTPTHQTDHVY